MTQLFDAWTWIEYFEDGASAKEIEAVLKNSSKVYTPESTISEILTYTIRTKTKFDELFTIIHSNSDIVSVNLNNWLDAAELKFYWRKKRQGFGLMDALLLAKAKELDAKIVTGDPHFKGIKNVMFLK